MRLDELPRSEKIEDRRGSPGGFRGGRGGLGVGTIIVLGLIGLIGAAPRVVAVVASLFLALELAALVVTILVAT